jgi:hypothetical protein
MRRLDRTAERELPSWVERRDSPASSSASILLYGQAAFSE